MSDIDLVVKQSRIIESLLKTHYHAEGKGLHQLITSCEERLPHEVIRKLRFIATMRNKVVHEEGYKLENKATFKATCKDMTNILTPRANRFLWKLVGAIVLLSTLASLAIYLIHWDNIKNLF
ncbi:DUF4145 domain-containing protein [Aliivibrio sp. S3MY1]|uniref:DUF4145 domain-containing protein n=1 Tax=unclassified Aliivibrio TaxID=2645654 RepID=UPI0023782608|nr:MULTISPECIES: DUF4145 domain-containing protein [unclassified Aliivibrio]MDD9196579.1 DUF4145 domain-containing protein [Aliivibrio sp. S3MY1]MDD9199963.1 DUF4145 domain-containing protein [Aliivibrio sp. S2MY1]